MTRKRSQKKKNQLDVDMIRDAATGRWLEILQVVGGIPVGALDGRHHPCPKCGGSDRFRLVDREAGAVLCNQCFREKNGDGFAAIQWMLGCEFLTAASDIANHLGIDAGRIGGSGKKKLATDHLSFVPWNESIIALWCLKKKPITVEALRLSGAKLARYLGQYIVIALPVWGSELTTSEPVGWVLYNSNGSTLPVFENNEVVDWVKVKTLAGTRAGLIGVFGQGGLVIKTEGPSDALSLISTGWDKSESIICNVHGCGENPRKTPWLGDFFTGRDVVTIGDLDRPGQEGAVNWARFAAVTASAARVAKLPGPILENHGSDLRDYLAEHSRTDLDELINQAAKVDPDEGTRAIEAVDDPYRLARINLERYASRTNGRTIRYWNSSWWIWKNCRYREMEENELRAKMTASIKEEFDNINIEEQKAYFEKKEAGLLDEDEMPPVAKKVTPHLVASVMNATRGMITLSGECELDTWIPDRRRRNYISLRNGMLDIDAVFENKDTKDCLLPHSPEWFSTVHLPYDFDPKATCPKWEAFLEKNLEGDHERINCLQEWAGYLLLPDTGEQRFLILEGEGANGKSVFCAGIEAVLGRSNCSHVQFEIFGDRFSKTMTLGKLVNICGDAGEIDQVAEGMIKAFTSGNPILFDRKGLPGVHCTPTARLMIACNNLPRFRDRSQGIWRRAMITPWKVTISREERVKNMDKASWWEDSGELPGMFKWALLGLIRLKRQGGFTESVVMEERKEEYRLESNPAKQFILEMLEDSNPIHPLRLGYLYQFYRKWTLDSGCHPLSSTQFGKEISRAFPSSKRVKRGPRTDRENCYVGFDYREGSISSDDFFQAYMALEENF